MCVIEEAEISFRLFVRNEGSFTESSPVKYQCLTKQIKLHKPVYPCILDRRPMSLSDEFESPKSMKYCLLACITARYF